MEAISWIAVLKGKIYCSPACGYNCKHADFETATQEGQQLAKKLGPDWTPRIWENMGWHYQAISPDQRCHVSKNRHGGDYTAYLHHKPLSGGRWTGKGATPGEAVDLAYRSCSNELDVLQATLDSRPPSLLSALV